MIGQLITFDMLPDDILIEIFDFYVDEDMGEDFGKQRIQDWMTLVHVCRRWRSLVFQSPRRLNLRLVCTPKTPPSDTLGIWPPLPLVIHDTCNDDTPGVNNTIAALEHNDRVSQIHLICWSYPRIGYITGSAAMQKSFPELTHLELGNTGGQGPILPDSFLGGTAPRLRSLWLHSIPFPGLSKLLLSATNLVKLELHRIPYLDSGYIPPELMATWLSALISLEFLHLQIIYSQSTLESQRLPPPLLSRSILPILTTMLFTGASGYLEEILTRIDAPRLNEMHITFTNIFISDTRQLLQFISRTPTLMAPKMGHITFISGAIVVKFPSRTSGLGVLSVKIPSMMTSEWPISRHEQFCTSSLPLISTLEDLYILQVGDLYSLQHQLDDVENTLWLQLLHPFAAVRNLYLCKNFEHRIAPALEELAGARTTEVLPALDNIFLEGLQPLRPFHEGIERFVAARQLTSHPVAVSRWDKDSE